MSRIRVPALLTRGLQLLVVLFVGGLLVGQFLGHPLILAFVETGSMQPTLDPGDGFVALPPQIVGPIEEGDIIVYRAEEVGEGGLTTHRVIGRSEAGFITKGDANPFSDQAAGEPPIPRSQIIAVALQVDGHVVTIPHVQRSVTALRDGINTIQLMAANMFGTRLFLGTQGLLNLIVVVIIGYLLIDTLLYRNRRDDRRSGRNRSRNTGINSHTIIAILTLLFLSGVTASMVVPAGTEEITIRSIESNYGYSESEIVRPGETVSVNVSVNNNGLVPVLVYFSTNNGGVDVQPRRPKLGFQASVNATVTAHLPEKPGRYRITVSHIRYLAVLPAPLLDFLYQIHPWAPIAVIDTLVGIPFYLLGVRLVGTDRIRNRSRSRDLPLLTRCRRLLKQLY